MLKLIRNHFLDIGFKIDGKSINKNCLAKILSASFDDLTIVPRISNYHLNVRGSERQKVKQATHIFTSTTAKAVQWCGLRGYLDDTNWQETNTFLKLVNDWFDVFNAKLKYGSHPGENAFVIDFDNPILILSETSNIVSKMLVGNHKSLVPFQKGILLSQKSIVEYI